MSPRAHRGGPNARYRAATPGDAAPQRILAIVAYDGSAYSGWQVQPQHPSVQGEIERVLDEITGYHPRVHSSGRTDTGVHARAQPAHFDLPFCADVGRLQTGLNALLPADIRVTGLRAVPADFHARYGCTGKEYRYFIWNGPILPPFLVRYRTWERKPLDEAAMRKAARRLVGRRDFAPFSANPNREIDGTVRDLRLLDVRRRGSEITIVARADGFLYRMVRSLAGFLIRVGRGELPPESADEILAHGIRTARVPTAPPQGLFLWKVFYPPPRRGSAKSSFRSTKSMGLDLERPGPRPGPTVGPMRTDGRAVRLAPPHGGPVRSIPVAVGTSDAPDSNGWVGFGYQALELGFVSRFRHPAGCAEGRGPR